MVDSTFERRGTGDTGPSAAERRASSGRSSGGGTTVPERTAEGRRIPRRVRLGYDIVDPSTGITHRAETLISKDPRRAREYYKITGITPPPEVLKTLEQAEASRASQRARVISPTRRETIREIRKEQQEVREPEPTRVSKRLEVGMDVPASEYFGEAIRRAQKGEEIKIGEQVITPPRKITQEEARQFAPSVFQRLRDRKLPTGIRVVGAKPTEPEPMDIKEQVITQRRAEEQFGIRPGTTFGELPVPLEPYSKQLVQRPGRVTFRPTLFGGGFFIPEKVQERLEEKPSKLKEFISPFEFEREEREKARVREEVELAGFGIYPKEEKIKDVGITLGAEETYTQFKPMRFEKTRYEKEYLERKEPTKSEIKQEFDIAKEYGALGVAGFIGLKGGKEALKWIPGGYGVGKLAKIPKIAKWIVRAERTAMGAGAIGLGYQAIKDPYETALYTPEIIGGGLGYGLGRTIGMEGLGSLTKSELKLLKKSLRTVREREQFDAMVKLMNKLKKQKSVRQDILTPEDLSKTKIPKKSRQAVINLLKTEDTISYGSGGVKGQILGIARMPKDLDVGAVNPKRFAKRVADVINIKEGKRVATARGDDVFIAGKKIMDIHSQEHFFARWEPGGKGYGYRGEELIDIGGIKTIALGEQFVRKGTAVLEPEQWAFWQRAQRLKKAGKPLTSKLKTKRWRKDVADFFKISKTLIESKEIKAKEAPPLFREYKEYQAGLARQQLDILAGRKPKDVKFKLPKLKDILPGKRGEAYAYDISISDEYLKGLKKRKIYKYPLFPTSKRDAYWGVTPRLGEEFYSLYPKGKRVKEPFIIPILTKKYPRRRRRLPEPFYPKGKKVPTPTLFTSFVTEEIITEEEDRRKKSKKKKKILRPGRERRRMERIFGREMKFPTIKTLPSFSAIVLEKFGELKPTRIFTGLEKRPIPLWLKRRIVRLPEMDFPFGKKKKIKRRRKK